MEVKIIKIGTSKGLRLPSKVLKTFENPKKFKLTITEQGIFLKPQKDGIRENWKDEFIKSQNCILSEEYKY